MEYNINNDNYIIDGNDEKNQTLNLSKLENKIQLKFDYEMNMAKLEDSDSSNSKILYLDEKSNQYKAINYNLFFDKLKPLPKITPTKDPKKSQNNSSIYDADFEELDDSDSNNDNLKKANLFKRLVSKQKRRFQDSEFDLDMSYITEKVIAMGYPSTGIQTIYRNSLSDIIKFFHVRHNDEVKVYNLCLEKDRIYNKNIFPNSKVGLFPATDHNPCPIKLILEFCIDLCLYLIKNPKGVAAVHCKAGKGRTGVMICSYLVFSGLCQSSEKSFRYYARVRTKNNTGVTIASQKRYIKYFENFLESNFYQPYIKLIPKIIRSQFSFLIDGNDIIKINNILQSFEKEKSYFISSNIFKLKGIKLGPLPKGKELKIKISNFIDNKFKLPKKFLIESKDVDKDGNTYYEQFFTPELIVHSDIKIKIKENLNFFLWINLWYSTWEMIKNLYDMKIAKIPSKSVKDMNFQNLETINKVDEVQSLVQGNNNEKLNNINTENFIENNVEDNFEKISNSKSLYEIVYKLKHNTDLNELINQMNSSLNLGFSRDMKINLNSFEFDKFQEKNEYSNLQMTIFYSLVEK